MDPDTDYSKEPQTLVEFRLSKTATGTLLVVTESGFENLPSGQRRLEAIRMNAGGEHVPLWLRGEFIFRGGRGLAYDKRASAKR